MQKDKYTDIVGDIIGTADFFFVRFLKFIVKYAYNAKHPCFN